MASISSGLQCLRLAMLRVLTFPSSRYDSRSHMDRYVFFPFFAGHVARAIYMPINIQVMVCVVKN